MEQASNVESECVKPTPYKISTITATGSINTHVNLPLFYKYIEIIDNNDTANKNDGYMYIEYGKKKAETFCKGFHKKMTVTRRKKQEGKRFDNQATVILRCYKEATDTFNCANMKVFRNGNVQMTGLKQPEQGMWALEYLIKSIRDMAIRAKQDDDCEETVVDDIDAMIPNDYQIRLINSDFRIGFAIKRDKLCKLLHSNYGVLSSFEPCIYPGVKIQYCWNTIDPTKSGTCSCIAPCSGKGTGSGDGQCKRITIAVFQSGCIIITGAQTCKQIDRAYKFICEVVIGNKEGLHKQCVVPLIEPVPKATRKKVVIQKCNIRVPKGYVLEK